MCLRVALKTTSKFCSPSCEMLARVHTTTTQLTRIKKDPLNGKMTRFKIQQCGLMTRIASQPSRTHLSTSQTFALFVAYHWFIGHLISSRPYRTNNHLTKRRFSPYWSSLSRDESTAKRQPMLSVSWPNARFHKCLSKTLSLKILLNKMFEEMKLLIHTLLIDRKIRRPAGKWTN